MTADQYAEMLHDLANDEKVFHSPAELRDWKYLDLVLKND